MLINELLNIKYPIFQGAMSNITDGKFTADVSNAGGLGIIASGALTSEELKCEIEICKKLTSKPFGVNIMVLNPHINSIIEMLKEQKVEVITIGGGNPCSYITKLNETGSKVFPIVGSVALAKRVEKLGAFGVIVEGCEAGGHIGQLTTMTLLYQVASCVSIPVISAGGIASGAQLNAALAMGACGIQIGTLLLASFECPIHQNYKEAILKAKDSDTIVTASKFGQPVRVLKNEMSRNYVKLEQTASSQYELEYLTLGGLKKAINGDVINGSLMAGQVSGQIKEIRSVEEIFKKLIEESLLNKNDLLKKIDELYKIS